MKTLKSVAIQSVVLFRDGANLLAKKVLIHLLVQIKMLADEGTVIVVAKKQ